jgi:hypothetical protein
LRITPQTLEILVLRDLLVSKDLLDPKENKGMLDKLDLLGMTV